MGTQPLGAETMLSFWIAAIGLPLVALFGNAIIRAYCKLEPSSSADFVLLFIVFDGLVIIQHHEFEHYISNETIKGGMLAIYVILLITNSFLWMASAFRIEPELSLAFDSETKRYRRIPFAAFFGSYFISFLAFFSNILTFAYRG
jgi:hypothetical protein